MADTLTTQLNRSGAAILMTVSITDVADVNLTALSLETLASLVLWYLLGYAFYSFMYGALGATISRQKGHAGGRHAPRPADPSRVPPRPDGTTGTR
ncbi:MAG: hypothetical protein GY788_17100 [bacterium]|nr:hypothetical protein [bacterium]